MSNKMSYKCKTGVPVGDSKSMTLHQLMKDHEVFMSKFQRKYQQSCSKKSHQSVKLKYTETQGN